MAEYLRSPWMLLALIPVGFFLLLFFVALFEHILIHPYVLAPDDENFLAPLPGERDQESIAGLPRASQVSDYVAMMSAGIHGAGFAYHGLLAHAKAPRIQILTTVWMSADQRMIVTSGSGYVLKSPSYSTRIYTPLKGGKWLVTTDDMGAGDPSRHLIFKRVINVAFERLLEAHLQRLTQHGATVNAFAEANAVDALFALFEEYSRLMVKEGIARYRDQEKTKWSYTAKGGVLVCLGFFEQLGVALLQFGRAQGKPIASPELKTRGS